MSRLPGRPRVVFDCNIFLQAMAFERGPGAEALRRVESGTVELFLSQGIWAELCRVLAYRKVLAISPNMTATRINAFLQRLRYRATFLRRVPRVFSYARDPKDEPYMNLAAAVHADFLVSRDKDLLWLMEGHTAFCKEFRQKTRPLMVLLPGAFLEALDRF